MSKIKVICCVDNNVQTGAFGNVQRTKDLIPLVFYLTGQSLNQKRLMYHDRDFDDWIDFDTECELKDLPNPLKLKVVDVADGSFYEGKDYETIRREEEEDEIMGVNEEVVKKENGGIPSISTRTPETKKTREENGIEVLSPSEIEDIPYSPEASIDEGTFEGIEFFNGDQLGGFDEFGSGSGLELD